MMENVSSEDSTIACGSIITKNEVANAESDLSTSAVGPEIVLTKQDTLAKKHTLQRFFSVMTLLEGTGTSDETDRATASAVEANSLEEKSQKTSSTTTDDTADESESSSVAIALFDKNDSTHVRVKKSSVLPPSSTAANRDAKKKVVSMMIEKFKHIAGKGACLCENTNSSEELVYEQHEPYTDITGMFSRDVGDSESHISCAIDHDDTFTLDSMIDGNRMYM
jgi:hypothetical protein